MGAAADFDFKALEYADTADDITAHIEWDYDAYGRKLAQTTYDGSGSVTAQTRYVYDGVRLIQEVDALNGNAIITDYVHGPGYVDDVIRSRRDLNTNDSFADTENFYHLQDQQHSTVGLIDGTGAAVEYYTYDAFGVPTIYEEDGTTPRSVSIAGNDILYTGRTWLPELNLYDYRQRMYDPSIGRFLSTDPAFDPANMGNPYTYVGNNPGANVDPNGDVAESVWDAASLGIGTASFGYNIYNGNWFDAGLDAVGIVADAGATLVPFLPGGAGIGLKAYRVAQKADTVISAGQGVAGGIDASVSASQGDYAGAAINVVGAGLQTAHVGTRVGGMLAGTGNAADALQSPAKTFEYELFEKYQQYTDEGYSLALKRLDQGTLTVPNGLNENLVIGQNVDNFARNHVRDWLKSEKISEGAKDAVQVNRRLYNPIGNGAYRIPDVRLTDSNRVFEGTLSLKGWHTPQVRDMYNFTGGARITVVRPMQLGGSYSLLP